MNNVVQCDGGERLQHIGQKRLVPPRLFAQLSLGLCKNEFTRIDLRAVGWSEHQTDMAASSNAESSSLVSNAQCTLALSQINTSPACNAPAATMEYTKSKKSWAVLLSSRGMERNSGSLSATEVTNVILYDLDKGTSETTVRTSPLRQRPRDRRRLLVEKWD